MLVRTLTAGYDSSPPWPDSAWPEDALMWKRPYTWLLLLLVALGLLLGGCRTLNLGGFGGDHDKHADKAPSGDKPAVTTPETPADPRTAPFGRPGKHSLRIAPYVFHSDFEL